MSQLSFSQLRQSLPLLRQQLPPLTPRNVLLSSLALLVPPVFLRLRANYHAYLAAGRGGMPHNVIGWAAQWVLHLTIASKDTINTSIYDDPAITSQYGEPGQLSYISSPLVPRKGSRPQVLPWVVPHRMKEPNSAAIREKQRQEFLKIAEEKSDSVRIATSRAERHEDALWLQEGMTVPDWAKKTTRGEIAHIHLEVDGSSHVTLSMKDAKDVIEKGWGERHKMSGTFVASWGFVLLYAPRDEAEVEVMGQIFRAGIDYSASY